MDLSPARRVGACMLYQCRIIHDVSTIFVSVFLLDNVILRCKLLLYDDPVERGGGAPSRHVAVTVAAGVVTRADVFARVYFLCIY